jgi:outer membrane biosynthesis protein TonB
MMKKVLLILVIVVTSLVTAQTDWTQDQPVTQPRDLRLEHADVPMYPQLARTARIFGTVEVQVTVKDGKVVNTDVKSGPPVLAKSTVENIQSWRFYRLVNATFTTKFIYQLETKEPLDPQNPKVELQLPLLARITAVPVHLDTQNSQPTKSH